MKFTLLFYLLSIIVALVLGGVSVWDAFSPSAQVMNDSVSLTPVAKVLSVANESSLLTISASKLWNIKAEKKQVVLDDTKQDESPWEITLKNNIWFLTRGNEKDNGWLFQGVLFVNGCYSAVLYNKSRLQKWTIVGEAESFQGLNVLKVSDKELVLQDSTNKQWHLGLFHLKPGSSQDIIQ